MLCLKVHISVYNVNARNFVLVITHHSLVFFFFLREHSLVFRWFMIGLINTLNDLAGT